MDFDLNADKRVADVIPLEFWTDHEDVNGENVLVEWVRWQKKGNPNHQGEGRVRNVKRHQSDVWEALIPAYEAWKKNEQMPVNGTPIGNWPPITKRLAEVMKTNGFLSVEDLSKANDADLGRIGMGALALRDKAREFVALKVDTKSAGQIDTLKKQVEELTARLALMDADKPDPKKRGRKPKEVAE